MRIEHGSFHLRVIYSAPYTRALTLIRMKTSDITFVSVSPVSERSDCVDVETVLLLTDGRVPLLHLHHVRLLVRLESISTTNVFMAY